MIFLSSRQVTNTVIKAKKARVILSRAPITGVSIGLSERKPDNKILQSINKTSEIKPTSPTLISFLSIIIPLAIVIGLASVQISSLASGATAFFQNFDSTEFSNKVIDFINEILALSPIHIDPITPEQVLNWIRSVGKDIGTALLDFFARTASSFIGWFSSFIIYLFVFISLIKNGPLLMEMFRKINPLGEDVSNVYLQKSGAMIKGTVFGQFVIATVQGLGGATAFAIAGYPETFFVAFIIFTLLSIIPLGAGILIIPLGIIMALFGNVWGGVIVIAEHLLINTNIDNILRPILVPKAARLDSALMIVSVFAGISMFGFLGIIVGPTIMILIVTTVKLYLEEFKSYTVEPEKNVKKA